MESWGRMAYKFSVIVELVKNKKKLKQTLNSLKGQTLDFNSEIQVILLADSRVEKEYLQFCTEFAASFSENVLLLGRLDFSQVQGTWISCLQEGQEWSPLAFETVVRMEQESIDPIDFALEKYKEETAENKTENSYDFVLNQMWKFEGELGKYIFSRRFDEEIEKIVQANEKLEVMYQLALIMVKAEYMIVLEKEQLTGKKKYAGKQKEWYCKQLPDFGTAIQQLKASVSDARKEQLDLIYMTQLAESMKDKVEDILSEEEIRRYELWLQEALEKIDDAVINRANMNAATRRYAFSLKDGEDIAGKVVCRNGKFYYKNMLFFDIKNAETFIMHADESDNHKIIGVSYHPLQENQIIFYLTDGEKEYPFVYKEKGEKVYRCLNHVERQERIYECILPAEIDPSILYVECIYMGKYVTNLSK